MSRQLFYATTNPGKVMEARKIFQSFGLDFVAPAEIGLTLDVEETGSSLEENATLKARAYLDVLAGEDYVVIGDDTGVEIDALNGEPGIHVRRWRNHRDRMADEDIIHYCLQRMAHVPPGKRGAQFRTVFALGVPGQAIERFDGTLRGEILLEAAPRRIEGFPFESIFFVPEWGIVLGDVYDLTPEEKARCATHRQRALANALPRIREWMA